MERTKSSAQADRWTRRQRQVLDLVADGYSNREIADRLGISLDGAKWHVSELLGRAGVTSREELAEYWKSPASRPGPNWWRAVVLGAGIAAGAGGLAVSALLVLANLRGDEATPEPAATTVATPGPPRAEFSPAAPMAHPRSLHASVTLRDGSVLVLGGNTPANPPVTASIERFDPGRLVFEDVGTLLEPRQFFPAVLLDDGTVLVAGGVGNDGPLSTAEVYDPATATSVAVSPLTTALAGHSAVKLDDGRVLLLGGRTSGGFTTATQLFDPVTKTFSPGPTMNVARTAQRAVTLADGAILVVGDGSAERFDPASGRFKMVAGPDANLPEVPTLLANGKVLVTGGYDVAEERATPDPDCTSCDGDVRPATARAVLLDPVSGQVTPIGPMITPRLLHDAIRLHDGRVLIAGGAQTTHFDGEHVAAAEVFDPVTNSFTPVGPMSRGRVWFTMNLLPPGGDPTGSWLRQDVLVVGDNGGTPSPAEIYHP